MLIIIGVIFRVIIPKRREQTDTQNQQGQLRNNHNIPNYQPSPNNIVSINPNSGDAFFAGTLNAITIEINQPVDPNTVIIEIYPSIKHRISSGHIIRIIPLEPWEKKQYSITLKKDLQTYTNQQILAEDININLNMLPIPNPNYPDLPGGI